MLFWFEIFIRLQMVSVCIKFYWNNNNPDMNIVITHSCYWYTILKYNKILLKPCNLTIVEIWFIGCNISHIPTFCLMEYNIILTSTVLTICQPGDRTTRSLPLRSLQFRPIRPFSKRYFGPWSRHFSLSWKKTLRPLAKDMLAPHKHISAPPKNSSGTSSFAPTTSALWKYRSTIKSKSFLKKEMIKRNIKFVKTKTFVFELVFRLY